ncbi:MAG: ABC transporter substrate-binding protein [Halofilum sp. (in: g-proteobacteria)]|nr:ABC transporter substrate-binding protein [Halofilum sp. (in: g-proteobacteria)]
MRRFLLKTLAPVLGLCAASGIAAAQPVVVGSTNFAEQLILANIYAEVLEDRGVEVETRLNLGSREIVYPALVNGEIDILPEYTGALLAHVHPGEELPATKEKAVEQALRKALPKEIVMLEPSKAQDKDTLVVRPETAKKYDLETFSDLAPVAGELIVGGPPEMKTRRVGLPGMKDVYGVEFKEFRSLDAGGPVTTGALANGSIDVARMFTTQGVIDERGWVVLEDDKELNPAQNLVPVVRREVLNGTIRSALNEVSAKLTNDGLQRLNRQVGVDKRDPADVAAEWVRAQGVVD